MGEEALGPVKVICPSIGDCQGQEVGVGGLVSSGRGKGIRGSSNKATPLNPSKIVPPTRDQAFKHMSL